MTPRNMIQTLSESTSSTPKLAHCEVTTELVEIQESRHYKLCVIYYESLNTSHKLETYTCSKIMGLFVFPNIET